MAGRQLFKKLKNLITLFIYIIKLLPKSFRIYLWECTSKHSQLLYIGFRYIILKSLIKKCGNNVRIGPNVTIVSWEKLIIGNNVSIHANSYIDASGIIIIENNVSLAHNSSIISSNHSWSDKEVPIKYNEIILNKVHIEEDVWIGCGCRILGGITIRSRSIIAAGAVVNKDVETQSIYGGVPAKLIKYI